MSDKKPEIDPIIQDQLNHIAKSCMHATSARISMVMTINEGVIQTAVSNRGEISAAHQAKLQNDLMHALASTADAIMQQSTNGAYRLLVMGPNGVVPCDQGIEATIKHHVGRG